jgi:hypothetical protein
MWRSPRGGELRGRNVAASKPSVRIVSDPEELAREGAGIFIATVQEAIREKET